MNTIIICSDKYNAMRLKNVLKSKPYTIEVFRIKCYIHLTHQLESKNCLLNVLKENNILFNELI